MSETLQSGLHEWFVGSTAVITGGARGIGLGIATMLADAGAEVLLLDLDEDALAEAVAERPDLKMRTLAVDLLSPTAGTEVDAALAGAAPLRTWVNNAGVVSHASADDVEIDDFELVQRKNSSSVLIGCKIARRHMTAFDNNAIVNISSEAAMRPMPRRISYGVSKSSVSAMTRYLAYEWGTYGIRVNAICPGHIATRLTEFKPGTDDAKNHEAMLASLPVSRRGAPSDIAGAVLYLSSGLSSYVTGQSIAVDGGWSLL